MEEVLLAFFCKVVVEEVEMVVKVVVVMVMVVVEVVYEFISVM